jgi:hypothetical protein
MKLPDPGLYRTTKAYPGQEATIPAGVLVYIGEKENGSRFVVRPGSNRRNRWFWGEPTITIRALSWSDSLKALPSEGFYTLPEDLDLGGGGRWLRNAIVQLGYNGNGEGILFVGEDHRKQEKNVLIFSDKGVKISDDLLYRLNWAPILPVTGD